MSMAMAAAAVSASSSWIPQDDLLLKNAIEGGASLESLAKGAVRFSRKFTIRELRERWHSLLYDADVSSEASSRMLELELSCPNLSSKFVKPGVSREALENPAKRKVESVRRLYYAMRRKKKKRTCGREEYGALDFGFLGRPDGDVRIGFEENIGAFDDRVSRSGCLFGHHDRENRSDLHTHIPYFEPDIDALKNKGNVVGDKLVVFQNCSPSFDMEGISKVPLWKTIEDVSAPEMPIGGSSVEDKAWGEGAASMDHDGGGSNKMGLCGIKIGHSGCANDVDVLNGFTVIPESDLADLSDALLNFEGENEQHFMDVEGEDRMDKSCYEETNSELVSSPNYVVDDIPDVKEPMALVSNASPSVHANEFLYEFEAIAAKGSISGECDQFSHSYSEINPPSSILEPNTSSAKQSGGEMECVLSSEDPEIPCNDDIVFSAKKFASSAKKTNSEGTSYLSSYPNQLSRKDELIFIKRENSAQSFNSSHMMGLEMLHVTNPSPQLVNCSVGCDSPDKSPTVPPSQVDNGCGDSQSRSVVAAPISASVGVLKADSLYACNSMNLSLHAKTSSHEKTVSVPEADPTTSHEEESGSEDDVPSFSDIEAMILEMDLCPDDLESCINREVIRYQNVDAKRTILRLEQCALSSTQRAIASRGAHAVLYGRHLKHYIKGTEVMLGRATDDVDVDIDLGREGPANKISRRQALIKMEGNGYFSLKNLGKGPIYLNGKELVTGQRMSLGSNSLIEIRGMAFVFEMNAKSVRRHLENAAKTHKESSVKFEWSEGVP